MSSTPDNHQNRPAVEPARAVTPARAVAVALIAVTLLGLLYLRFARGSETVSVPDGARAGDLVLEHCTYDTEDGRLDADCGTLVVPEDRTDPASRLIALPITRIRARSPEPAEPIFRLEGGPGVTNMQFPKASRFADDHDVVLVGYRGVDGSVRLDCPEVESALGRSTDVLGDRSLDAYAAAFRACADRLTADGVDLAGYGLAQQVEDLEAARRALGYERIDLLSESAGTRTAQIYAARHPRSIHRSVMIAANPPGNFLWDPAATAEQLRRYASLCAKDPACDGRTDDLVATMRETAADLPDRWFFLPIDGGNVRVASFLALMESTAEAAPASAPLALDAWLDAAEGDAGGLWFASLAGELLLPKMFVWGQYAAAGMLDADAARKYFAAGEEPGFDLGRDATTFVWGGGRLADAWPAAPDASELARVRRSEVETLLIGGELDFATPPQQATKQLLPHLPNGRQVVLPGIGHTIDFWTHQPEASTRLISTFLESGRVDDSLYEPTRVDFTPTLGLGAIAKIALGALLALASLTVLSLLLIWRRVSRRGGFGRRAGVLLRSAYAVVLGLGGWVLGVLVALTVLPGVPLDDPLLAVLSVGLPVALAAYWGWLRPGRPAGVRLASLLAAAAGSVAGAWLGLGAAEGLAGLLTAAVGAVAGANLGLVALDAARGRAAGTKTASTPAATPAGFDPV